MLERFAVKGYKVFENRVSVDFGSARSYPFNEQCLNRGIVSKALLYGENGAGKSCLGAAITDLAALLSNHQKTIDRSLLNANTDERRIAFEYGFDFDGESVQYAYEKDDEGNLLSEQMKINGKHVYCVNCLDPSRSDFSGIGELGNLNLDPEIYLSLLEEVDDEDRIAFLKWVFNASMPPRDSLLSKIKKFIRRMICLSPVLWTVPYSGYEDSITEDIDPETAKGLQAFFSALGFEIRLVSLKRSSGNWQLCFDHKRPLPFFENASSGLKALATLYLRLHPVLDRSSFLYLDDFDAFLDSETAKRLFIYFRDRHPDVQMICTAHHTDLISNEITRPDCIFLLTSSEQILPLDQATNRRLKEGHNIGKMYRSGEFLGAR